MSYIPEYHENYYRVEGTAYNQGKIGIGTVNPVQLLHVSGGNIRVDGSGYINGDLNVSGNLNVYGTSAQFAVSQIIAEDKSIELNVATGSPIGGGSYTPVAFSDDAGAENGGITLKSTQGDKEIIYKIASPNSGWVSNLRWIVSGNYGKDTLNLSDAAANVGLTIATDTNLYRSGANQLSTDDNFASTNNGGKTTLQLTNTAADVGITIGGDTNLYRSGANQLNFDDNLASTFNGGKTTFQLTNTAANVGMTIGGDTNLYRRAADSLTTDDSLFVGSTLNVGGNTTLTGDLSVQGSTTLGDTLASDLVTFNARAATSFEPNTNNTRNLGSSALNWATAFINTLQVAANSTLTGNLNVNGNATLGDSTSDVHTINGTLTNSLPDNTATVVDLKEATNSYLKLDTTNASELVTIGATPKFSSLNTTDATSSTAGAAIFAGGVGIAKKLYVGTDLNVIGYSIDSVNAAVTAGTDAQGQGALTKSINIITTNSSNPGAVTLPTAQAGMRIMIRNTTANGLKVYPATSAQIDALGANNAFGTTLTTNTQKEFYAISATQWYSI